MYTLPPRAATPTFSLAAGIYTSKQKVTIADSTPGATVYYTTDGSMPSKSSSVYRGPIDIIYPDTPLQAFAIASGYSISKVASATYMINLPVAAPPTFSVESGTYTTPQKVTISDATPGAIIHYQINTGFPIASSPIYTGPITDSSSEYIWRWRQPATITRVNSRPHPTTLIRDRGSLRLLHHRRINPNYAFNTVLRTNHCVLHADAEGNCTGRGRYRQRSHKRRLHHQPANARFLHHRHCNQNGSRSDFRKYLYDHLDAHGRIHGRDPSELRDFSQSSERSCDMQHSNFSDHQWRCSANHSYGEHNCGRLHFQPVGKFVRAIRGRRCALVHFARRYSSPPAEVAEHSRYRRTAFLHWAIELWWGR